MKYIYTRFFILTFLLITQINLSAQILPKLEKAFNQYQKDTFREKLYVHTDRDFYLTGELLWFKIYNVDADNHKPEGLSKVAYVEVIDLNNIPVLQAKISLTDGKGSGSFYIPVSITNGHYKLRAYTKWMQNLGPEAFFEKQLTVVNPLNSPEAKKVAPSPIDLQFFPEGGDLISEIYNNIGFKAIGTDGKGIDVQGVIVNQKNDTITKLQTLKYGMGKLNFKPLANQSYKAIVRSPNGDIVIKDLPTAKQKGYAIDLTNPDADVLQLNVNTNVNADKVYFVIHNGKTITSAVMGPIAEGKTSFKIDQSKLNDGISHFTIFNEDGQPVCERLFFKKPVRKLNIDANSESLQYKGRKKVIINWSSANELNKQEYADFSIAVYRVDSLQAVDQQDIVSYFWLTSNLKGQVEMPNYYLTNDSKESKLALNNLLLTQGWRKLIWSEILNANKPAMQFLPEVNGHLISGKLTQANGSPRSNTLLYMGIPSKRLQFYSTLSDSLGNFIVNTKDLYGPNEIVAQIDYRLDSTSKISIRNPFEERYSMATLSRFDIKPTLLNAVKKSSLNMQIQNVYANDKLKQFYYPGIDSAKFYGSPYKTYLLDDYTRFGTMEEIIREYVKEVFVFKKRDGFMLKVTGRYYELNENPLILLDGIPYLDVNQLMLVNPNNIKKLDVIIDDYYYGAAIYDGILSFSSFKGDIAGADIDPHAIVLDYEGMQLQREFYSPIYETDAQIGSRMPDFRNLLFWSPSIAPNKETSGQLNFYTSDVTGNYIGVIQGLSKNGIPGSRYFHFEVKK